jgi:DNA-binding HxlR family transcriptional regulator
MAGPRGSVELVEDVLGCKWTVQILGAIALGHVRPGRLRRSVGGISAKVLNERLGKLRRHGVLERRALAARTPHVEYRLTRKGRELARLIRQIRDFCHRWDEGPGQPAAALVEPHAAGEPPPRPGRLPNVAPRSRALVRCPRP